MHVRSFTATAHDLAEFHLERAAIYRVLAEIINVPPTPRALGALHEVFEEAKHTHNRPLEHLARALDGDCAKHLAGFFALLNSERGLPDTRCSDPENELRGAAFRTSGRTEDGSAHTELFVLAQLAEQSAHAIRQSDFTRAAELSNLQFRFLEEHGRTCLKHLAASLLESGFGPYATVAHVLHKQVEEDLRLLDAGTGDLLQVAAL
jgi:hypothetical protein